MCKTKNPVKSRILRDLHILHFMKECRQWDLNPHVVAYNRFWVCLVCHSDTSAYDFYSIAYFLGFVKCFFQFFSNFFEGAKPEKKNRLGNQAVLRIVACLEGFEPPTYWFVASHSIQLSYRHICLTTLFIIAHLFAFVKGFFKKILKKSKKVALCSRQLFLFGS